MSATPTPRELARLETLARIEEIAWRQLAASGAAGLSLRAVARELGVVSSAVYRYYPSRDDLLTALVVSAYGDLAARLEEAAAPDRRGARRRWQETCEALRAWALASPDRWSLVYGTTVPGYRAPADTIAPAARVVAAFCGCAGPDPGTDRTPARTAAPLRRQLVAAREALGLEEQVDEARMLLLVAAFTRVVGAVTLELGGHLVGTFEPADRLYEALVAAEADALGL